MKNFYLLLVVVFVLIGCSDKDSESVVDKIELSQTELSIKIDEINTLNVTHSPSHLPTPQYTWESSNDDVVMITPTGDIRGVSAGKSTITVSSTDNANLKASCIVTVEHIKPSSISLNKNSLETNIGNEVTLNYSISPANATLKEVMWTSSNPDVATVDDSGVVATKTLGETDIEISIINTELSAKCKIKVVPIEVTSVTFESSYEEILLGSKRSISATALPINAENRDIVYESSNPDIVGLEQIDGNYYIVANSVGASTIKAKSVSSAHYDLCQVEVRDISHFTSIKLLVGTEGNSVTGFYSYIYANFSLSINTPVIIKRITITDNTGEKVYVYDNLGEHVIYSTEKIITAQGLQTYPAKGWRVDATYIWLNKEYYISSYIP